MQKSSVFKKVYDTLTPPVNIDTLLSMTPVAKESRAEFANNYRRTYDEWRNCVASIHENNSLQQHTQYIFQRMPWTLCAQLATDPMINKALTTITSEMFNKGGSFKFIDEDANNPELLDHLEEIAQQYDIHTTIKKACRKGLEYGGAFIYIKTTDPDPAKPLYTNVESLASADRFQGFAVLEPWQFAPEVVNTYNPTKSSYMMPQSWWVMGAGSVHITRLIPIDFFPINYLYRPMFNYFGLPLSFFMKDFVSSADSVRQGLSDIFLRFSTDIIKTSASKIEDPSTIERVKHWNLSRNNLGTGLLANDEEYIQINTPLNGLDNIQSQMYEMVVASSFIPAPKLLGISPRGFQATGEHEKQNYYDTIQTFQSTVAKPALLRMAEAMCFLGLASTAKLDYVFEPLGQTTDKERAEILNLKADYLSKLVTAQIIDPDMALKALKDDDMAFSFVTDDEIEARVNQIDPDINQYLESYPGQTFDAEERVWRENRHPRDDHGRFSFSHTSSSSKPEKKTVKSETPAASNKKPKPSSSSSEFSAGGGGSSSDKSITKLQKASKSQKGIELVSELSDKDARLMPPIEELAKFLSEKELTNLEPEAGKKYNENAGMSAEAVAAYLRGERPRAEIGEEEYKTFKADAKAAGHDTDITLSEFTEVMSKLPTAGEYSVGNTDIDLPSDSAERERILRGDYKDDEEREKYKGSEEDLITKEFVKVRPIALSGDIDARGRDRIGETDFVFDTEFIQSIQSKVDEMRAPAKNEQSTSSESKTYKNALSDPKKTYIRQLVDDIKKFLDKLSDTFKYLDEKRRKEALEFLQQYTDEKLEKIVADVLKESYKKGVSHGDRKEIMNSLPEFNAFYKKLKDWVTEAKG